MNNRGFTLIEMLVSIGIFSLVMVVALGSLLALSEANRRASLMTEATNNFYAAIDSMARIIRTSTKYNCGAAGTLSEPRDCINGTGGSNKFSFYPKDATVATIYQHSTTNCPNNVPGCILRSQDGGLNYVSITSPDIVVVSLKFYVIGAPAGVQTFTAGNFNVQPKVEILITGYIQVQSAERSVFGIQTSVTQRVYDL